MKSTELQEGKFVACVQFSWSALIVVILSCHALQRHALAAAVRVQLTSDITTKGTTYCI